MKKILWAVIVLLLMISAPVFAEETSQSEMPGMTMDQPMGMPMSGMAKKCCPMMGKTQMVATDEGGVIVLAGSKLMKYDADLNLVKEVEVKMPIGPWGGKQCLMMMDKGTAADAALDVSEKAA